MTSTLSLLFWLMVFSLAYIYVGYPILVFVLGQILARRTKKGSQEPTVSIVIAAFNERAVIRDTLINKLSLNYPREKLEIIVVSDGSDDGTDDVVRTFAGRGVTLLRQQPRNGKSSALNLGVSRATGDIIVFSDANSIYEPNALRHLVANFADHSVGYVTGTLAYLNPNGTITGRGCSAYIRYEHFVRVAESSVGSLVGVNGGIDAMRRSLYVPLRPDDLPDFVLPLQVVQRGFRVVYEPQALLNEAANTRPADEYRMRVRVALRALWTLFEMSSLLNVRRHGFYAVQLLSHKVLRYFAFVFLTGALLTSCLLWSTHVVYRVAVLAQLALMFTALLGLITDRLGAPNRVLALPYYFMMVNAASLQAACKFVRGQRHRTWQPRLG